jgi:DNA-binding transcriptional MerR regulator
MHKTYTSKKFAQAVGIGESTLMQWLHRGLLAEPKREKHGLISFRVFSDSDLAKAIELKLSLRAGRPNQDGTKTDNTNSRLLELKQLLAWYADLKLTDSPLRAARQLQADLDKRLS